MTITTGRIRRLFAAFLLVSLALIGGAGIAAPAEAAPYSTTISITITISTNGQGQEVVSVTITNGTPNHTYQVILTSTDAVLGSITTNASGTGSGSFVLPAGTSGSQSIEVRDSTTGQVITQGITLSGTGGGTGGSGGSGSSSGGLPNTGAAVIGLGALAFVLVIAGGGLLIAGRRRGRSHQAA